MAKKVIPYGNRILVRRRKVGDKVGNSGLVLPDQTADRPTDLADVVYVADHTFADKVLIDAAEEIIKGLVDKAKTGDWNATQALISFNTYLKHKAITPGMTVFISKYVGTEFHDNEGSGQLTLVALEDVVGIVRQS